MSEGLTRIADLMPHAGPAVLLDEVLAQTATGLSARVTIRPDSPFHCDGGVPAHVGLEYMAQACGAFSGACAVRAGARPRIGFLLGTRRYRAQRAWFADGERLAVAVELVYRDADVGVFDCVILSGEDVVAEAQLIVAEPPDVAALVTNQDRTDDR